MSTMAQPHHQRATLDDHCEFCRLVVKQDREVIAQNHAFIAVFDKYPVNPGHTLLIATRHISTPFELTAKEAGQLISIINDAKTVLDERYQPAGYNIGINAGIAAGQTVDHLHVHLIPRYDGDVPKPRGGIRNFKPPLVHY